MMMKPKGKNFTEVAYKQWVNDVAGKFIKQLVDEGATLDDAARISDVLRLYVIEWKENYANITLLPPV
jgi:hypothetical protein